MSSHPRNQKPEREAGLFRTILDMLWAMILLLAGILLGYFIVIVPVVGVLKILGSLFSAMSGNVDHNFDP